MTGSTTVTLLESAANQLGTAFSNLLPIVVPAAIALAVLYGVLHWFTGAARRR